VHSIRTTDLTHGEERTRDHVHDAVGLALIPPENFEGKSQEGSKGTKSGSYSRGEEFPLDADP
jgi:hypothetical protein